MVISENCCIFIVLKYKWIQTIIAMIIENKVIEIFCMADDFASFLIQWWQNILFHLPQSVSITVIPPCPRQKSCWFWYSFMIQAIVVWSISIKKRSASICDTSFQRLSLITVLWSWKKRLPSPWLCLSKGTFRQMYRHQFRW